MTARGATAEGAALPLPGACAANGPLLFQVLLMPRRTGAGCTPLGWWRQQRDASLRQWRSGAQAARAGRGRGRAAAAACLLTAAQRRRGSRAPFARVGGNDSISPEPATLVRRLFLAVCDGRLLDGAAGWGVGAVLTPAPARLPAAATSGLWNGAGRAQERASMGASLVRMQCTRPGAPPPPQPRPSTEG